MELNYKLLSVPGLKQENFPLFDITIIFPTDEGKHESVVLKHPSITSKEVITSRLEKLFEIMLLAPAFHC